jgi:hypothetical protein
MSTTVLCPHCQGGVENRSDIAFQIIACPHCRRQFQMPAFEQLIVPQAQVPSFPQIQQPSLIVVGQRPQKRLKARGWFANTGAAAVAFFACAMLFVFGTCGGLYYWMKWEVKGSVQKVGESIIGTEKERTEVRRRAKVTLKPYGIVSVADNATAVRTDHTAIFAGKGLDARGKTHDISVHYDVNVFGGTTRWEPTSVVVDGEECLTRQ